MRGRYLFEKGYLPRCSFVPPVAKTDFEGITLGIQTNDLFVNNE
jgi:hypothetical protein